VGPFFLNGLIKLGNNKMKKLENKTEEITKVIDGAGILQNGTYLGTTKKEVEQMVLRNVIIIPDGRKTMVKNVRNKTIISQGNYFATPEEVEQMVKNKIKYQ